MVAFLYSLYIRIWRHSDTENPLDEYRQTKLPFRFVPENTEEYCISDE